MDNPGIARARVEYNLEFLAANADVSNVLAAVQILYPSRCVDFPRIFGTEVDTVEDIRCYLQPLLLQG